MSAAKSKQTKSKLRITVMEPGWDGHVHLPGNFGLLRVVCGAYPDAVVSYVAGAAQIALIKEMITPDIEQRVQFTAWPVHLDKDTLPSDVLASLKRLRSLPPDLTQNADLIVMTSCTATMLSAFNWSGLSGRSCTMLHGNANDLAGWRSRNPLRRMSDFTSALKWFCRQGGRVTVLEDRIRNQMATQYPWLASRLFVVPHPLLPEEAAAPGQQRELTHPIKIGFAGRASIAKGFPEFLELARQLHTLRPGDFEFHAHGMLAEECAALDQSALATKAQGTLSRSDYLAGLNTLQYLFAWHQDNYYNNAASGVVYDAVNLGIPMIARNCIQLSEWKVSGLNIANTFIEINLISKELSSNVNFANKLNYLDQCKDLEKLRESLSLKLIGRAFLKISL